METRNKRIVRFSASAAPKLGCLLRLKRSIIDGYQELMPYNDVLYGSAVHKFISTMHETNGDVSKATIEAKRIFSKPCNIRIGKKHLTEVHLLKVCFDYWEHYSKTDNFELMLYPDGKPMVEVSFSNLMFEDDIMQLYFEGVMDKFGKFKNGCHAIGDYKVTSSWNKEDFMDKYRLSSQLRFYRFNLLLSAARNPTSTLAEIAKYPVGYFVDGIFVSKDGGKFERSEVIVPSKEEDEEYAMLLTQKIIPVLIHLGHTPDYNYRDGILNGACSELKYMCEFLNVCSAPDDIARKHLLSRFFKQEPYLPLTHSKD